MTEIIIAIVAAIVGLGITIRVINKSKKTKSSNKINIKNSSIGGDVAGRDIKK